MVTFDPIGKSKKINCPNCDGSGEDITQADGKCKDCNGTGKLEAKVVKNG